MSARFALGLALVVLLGLFLAPVLIPMVLTSGSDGDDNLGGVPAVSGRPGCSMYCTEAPVSIPMPAPEVPVCPMFCDEGPVSLPLPAPEVK